jgi:hypothetical protein
MQLATVEEQCCLEPVTLYFVMANLVLNNTIKHIVLYINYLLIELEH